MTTQGSAPAPRQRRASAAMADAVNVIITGIGGQGVVTAAAVLRQALAEGGFRLAGYDNRGGAQRLGHVAAIVRFAPDPDRPLAPDVPRGACHLLLSLEASEGLRFADALGPDTVVVHSQRVVIPTNQRRAGLPYLTLDACHTHYRACAGQVLAIDLDGLANEKFGQPIVANLIALGAGAARLGVTGLGEAIRRRLQGPSLAAFDFGWRWAGDAAATSREPRVTA